MPHLPYLQHEDDYYDTRTFLENKRKYFTRRNI